jgi:hypothetical protein
MPFTRMPHATEDSADSVDHRKKGTCSVREQRQGSDIHIAARCLPRKEDWLRSRRPVLVPFSWIQNPAPQTERLSPFSKGV